jgi:glycosyltransferase involved in cell wall biosynthesis
LLKLLTIYIPTYNRAESLIKQLEAINYSGMKEYIEVIISDNCSNDVGYSKVKDFCEKENFVYKKNSLNIGADANIFNGFM